MIFPRTFLIWITLMGTLMVFHDMDAHELGISGNINNDESSKHLTPDCGKPLTYINETFGMNNTTGTQPIEGRSRRHIRTRDTGCKLGLVAGGVLGGAAVGAGIGTAIVPVIGTMIGGLLGVIGGVVGGRFGAQEFC